MADAPVTAMGTRRLRLLRVLAAAPAPMLVSHLASKTGWTSATVRVHLQGLEDRGFAFRPNYRRWAVPQGFTLRGFDATALD